MLQAVDQLLNSPITRLLNPQQQRNHLRPRFRAQSGYMLLAVMVMATLAAIWAAASFPRVAQEIRRERELELIHRGTQYARAIKRFYKKNGRYPARIEELENSNNIKYLRKRYRDPITGSDQWRIIHYGEAKVFPKMFGNQPVGSGPAGSPQGTTSPAAGTSGSTPGTQPTPTSTNGPAPTQPDQSGGNTGTATTPGTTTTTQPGTATAGTTTSSSGSSSSQPSGASGPTFGGAPIVGVSSTSQRESLMELNSKNHYNDWEFVYDPRFDPANRAGGAVTPQPNQPGQPAQQNQPSTTPTMPQPQVPR